MLIKRLTAAAVCAFMIMWVFLSAASCGDPKNAADLNETGFDSSKPTPQDAEEGREGVSDGVPADLKFDGQVFNLLSRSESQDGLLFGVEMGVEEEIGDIVNDTIYRRNINVEGRLDITINVIKIPGIWGAETSFNNTVRNSVKAGDNAYNLIAGYAYFITPLAAEGNFVNWHKVSYIDMSAPWWSDDLEDKMTLDGKLYFMSGDLSMTFIASMMCMLFNKRLQKDYGIDDLYQIVLDGRWTYDRLYGICKDIYTDVNGDGARDAGDIYGLTAQFGGNYCDQMFVSQNQPMTQKGDDGYPYLTLNTPKTIQITENMMSLLFDNPGVYADQEGSNSQIHNMFRNGQALFTMGDVNGAQAFRDMEDDFGILPFPKFDEAQEKYMGLIQDAYSLFSVPATNYDFDFVGAVTEALAAESYRYLTPAYYETALKIKYSRDDTTSQMLDIIREGARFDFALVNSNSMNNIIHIFRELSQKKSSDFVSLYEKSEQRYQSALDKLIDRYRDLD